MDSLIKALEKFAAATDELIESAALNNRVDSKFIVPDSRLPALLEELVGDYVVMHAAGRPIAAYENIYFDTLDLRCYHDHRRGRLARDKIRVRHYLDRELSFLEVKSKTNSGITIKSRQPLRFLDRQLDSGAIEFIRQAAAIGREELSPTTQTQFDRISLVGPNGDERVTIDRRIRISDAGGGRKKELSGTAIVEIKQKKFFARSPAILALRSSGARRRGISKYCTAMMLTDETLRGNEFLPTIKHIQGLSR